MLECSYPVEEFGAIVTVETRLRNGTRSQHVFKPLAQKHSPSGLLPSEGVDGDECFIIEFRRESFKI